MDLTSWPTAPFTWSQFEAAGGSRSQLSRAVAGRELRRVLHGVYVSGDVPDSLDLRCEAVRLVMRPFEVLCDRTAAWLHGVDTLEARELDVAPRVECVVLPDRTRARGRISAGGKRDLAPADVMRVQGISVTTPVRTALDLGCRPGAARALAIVEQFMRICGVTRQELIAELPRYRGRRGVRQLRIVVHLASPLAESTGESWTRMTIVHEGLPDPVLQYWVCQGGSPVYRVDLAYPHARIAIEFDGREFHDSPTQRAHDEERRGWLRERGWIVIVVRAEDLSFEGSRPWLNELRTALAGRTQR